LDIQIKKLEKIGHCEYNVYRIFNYTKNGR
jgi:hypothetical protein